MSLSYNLYLISNGPLNENWMRIEKKIYYITSSFMIKLLLHAHEDTNIPHLKWQFWLSCNKYFFSFTRNEIEGRRKNGKWREKKNVQLSFFLQWNVVSTSLTLKVLSSNFQDVSGNFCLNSFVSKLFHSIFFFFF